MYVERARAAITTDQSCSSLMTKLITQVDPQHRRKLQALRFRVPISLRKRIIEEFAEDYEDTFFGDLSKSFREYAWANWGLTYGSIDIVLDKSLRGYIAIDSLKNPQKVAMLADIETGIEAFLEALLAAPAVH